MKVKNTSLRSSVYGKFCVMEGLSIWDLKSKEQLGILRFENGVEQ